MDDLTERITQAIRDADADTLDYERRTPDCGYGTHAAAVMSVVEPAIQAAKAEAWDEAHEVGWNNADEYWRCDGLIPSYSKADTYPNPYRQEQTNE